MCTIELQLFIDSVELACMSSHYLVLLLFYQFAGRAMRIQNKPQVNELPTSHEAVLKKLAKMEEENRKLRSKLTQEGDDAEKESVCCMC